MNKIDLPAPHFIDSEPILIAGIREPLNENSAETIPLLWKKFAPFIGNISHQLGQVAFGLCVPSKSSSNGVYYYMAGCAVSEFANLPPELSPLIVPSQQYAIFAHDAHLSRIRETIDAVFDQWLPQSGYQHNTQSLHFFERYDENFNPETGLGGMEIWLPVIGG